MRIALIGPPFIAIPPVRYGGTELFIAHLARELYRRGHDVVVYGNGDSSVPCPVKWRYPSAEWPLRDLARAQLKNADHTTWAMKDAAPWADVIHLNDVVGVPLTAFVDVPTVLTIHHPHDPVLARAELMPKVHVVHHGIPLDEYTWSAAKDDYVAFLGRMAPMKGPHLAIDAARRAGVRLKLGGEIQPLFEPYWTGHVLPQIDGDRIEYIGEVDHPRKNRLLSRARALLFPIQWDEPFGLVMIEAMACGTPVLALPGGAVEEVIRDGVNGWICGDTAEMAERILGPLPSAAACRRDVARRFSVERMTDDYERIYERMLAGGAEARIAEAKA
jgi:glycosyltransferase involved in cell wall biosynthesis